MVPTKQFFQPPFSKYFKTIKLVQDLKDFKCIENMPKDLKRFQFCSNFLDSFI